MREFGHVGFVVSLTSFEEGYGIDEQGYAAFVVVGNCGVGGWESVVVESDRAHDYRIHYHWCGRPVERLCMGEGGACGRGIRRHMGHS